MEKPLLEAFPGPDNGGGPCAVKAEALREDDEMRVVCSMLSHQSPVIRGRQRRRRRTASGQECSPFPSPVGMAWQHRQISNASDLAGSEYISSSDIVELPGSAVPLEIQPPRSAAAAATHGMVYGAVNFIVCVPTLVSYAAIVFRLKAFEQDMPSLTKLFFLSSAIHQLIFTAMSSMSFAVGQIQDVGLIFLSEIATSVYIRSTQDHGYGRTEALATVLVACGMATTLTGVVVWLVGRLGLSGYVQLLPLPVVGGYLGYIGYFCLAAGASLGTGLDVEGFGTWGQFLVPDAELLTKLVLTIVFAYLLYYIAYRVENVAALPAVLVATPILFFVVLLVCGIPLDTAREHGWVPYPDSDPTFGLQCFKMYNGFQGIDWRAVMHELPTMVGLFCVVSFGSVLDIAAIQTEQPTPLDFDGELRMIGVANAVSGMFGGFTGSYIFSQTIFSQKQGVTSILNGLFVGIGELLLFFIPLDVLQFFPGFYIGGVMAFFGYDIMLDWLVHARSKVSRPEYALLWLTFFSVVFLGVIPGCVAGVAASAATFIVVYSWTPLVDVRLGCSSTAMRSFDERAALQNGLQKSIGIIELRGYLFFGAALQVGDNLLRDIKSLGLQWVVLDFTHVADIDSTSSRALAKLASVLRTDSVRLAVAAAEAKAQVQRLLRENGALPSEAELESGTALVCNSVDEGLAWCERGALRSACIPRPGESPASMILPMPDDVEAAELTIRMDPSPPQGMSKLTLLLREFVSPPPGTSPSKDEAAFVEDTRMLEQLAARLELRRFSAGTRLFEYGMVSDEIMVLIEGTIIGEPGAPGSSPHAITTSASQERAIGFGLGTFEPGALLGEVDYYLGRPRSYTATAGPGGCQVAILTRAVVQALESEHPGLALLAQRVALRSVCLLADSTTGLFMK
mmetsp:Transcript_115968/g.334891  ORF Transcript_115968/g.334891 Transcript_115968/m.334891 type:complete len:907 (+) Transcript_115968:54-2774(+)